MLSAYLTGKLLGEEISASLLNREKCLNHRSSFYTCRKCLHACLSGALHFNGRVVAVNKARCRGCGTCAAACPAQALSLKGFSWEKILSAAAASENPILGCSASSHKTTIIIPCGGGLHAEFLAAVAINRNFRPFTVDLYPCRNCNFVSALKTLWASLDRARTIAGPFPVELRLNADGEGPAETKPCSRRELLQRFGAGCSQFAKKLAVEMFAEKGCTKGDYRRLLLLAAGCRGTLRFPVWEVKDSCTGCERCESACPREAWKAVISGEELMLLHHPWKCTGCKLCAAICPQSAKKYKWATLNTNDLKPEIKRTFSLVPCQKCRQRKVPRSPGTGPLLCISCQKRESLANTILNVR